MMALVPEFCLGNKRLSENRLPTGNCSCVALAPAFMQWWTIGLKSPFSANLVTGAILRKPPKNQYLKKLSQTGWSIGHESEAMGILTINIPSPFKLLLC